MSGFYKTPDIDIINEWILKLNSLLKDVLSVNGSDQVLIEAYIMQAILTYFYEKEKDPMFSVMHGMRDKMFNVTRCSVETVMMAQIVTALYMEDQNDFP